MNKLFPEITDRETAKKAAGQGVGAAALVSLITAIMAIGGWLGAGPGALLDAALFAAIAFGIHKMSRTAAVLGLILYLVERIFAMAKGTGTSGMAMTVMLTIAFIQSVRATFAYHNIQPTAPPPNGLFRPAAPRESLYRNPRDLNS